MINPQLNRPNTDQLSSPDGAVSNDAGLTPQRNVPQDVQEHLNAFFNANGEEELQALAQYEPKPVPSPIDENGGNMLGTTLGITTEIGGGIYLSKKAKNIFNVVRTARAVSVAGAVAPEPATTVGGVLGLAATEAAAWGVSNLLGQSIRKGYGIQDDISAGEALGAAVFGTTLAFKGVQKGLSFGGGLVDMKAWGKGNEIVVNGVKQFVNGATLGVAETALRQEVQILLGERDERQFNEYVIAGVAGGTFNTVLDAFGSSVVGTRKMKKVVSRAKDRIIKQADEIDAKAKTAGRNAGRLRKQANDMRKAIELIDDLGVKIESAGNSKNNTNEPEVETPKPDAPEGEAIVTPRTEKVEQLRSELSAMNETTMSKKMPEIEVKSKAIYDEIYDEISNTVRVLVKEPDNKEARDKMLELVTEIRALNKDVKDVVETTAGRTLQAANRGAKGVYADAYSIRSLEEDTRWGSLEETLKRYDDEVEVPTYDELKNTPQERLDAIKESMGDRVPQELPDDPEAAIRALQDVLKGEKVTKSAQLLGELEDAIYKSLDVDRSSLLGRAWGAIAKSRQMALINQIPSALAGVGTGLNALVRESINRPLGNLVANSTAGTSMATKTAAIDMAESIKGILTIFSRDNLKAAGRTFKESQSATDRKTAGRLDEDLTKGPSTPRGEAALIARARRKAEKTARAQNDIIERASKQEGVFGSLNRAYWLLQSGGGRLIQSVDELFKRSMIKSRIRASARKDALVELEDLKASEGIDYTDADLDKLAKQKNDASYTDADGLLVLKNNHEYMEEVDLARRELLFAANSDNLEEVVTPVTEKLVKHLQELAGGDDVLGGILTAIMPYIGVPIRGVGKGIDLVGAPIRATGMLTGNVAMNPYTKQLNDLKLELDGAMKVSDKNAGEVFDNNSAFNDLDEGVRLIKEKMDRVDARRIQYNADTLADALLMIELFGVAGGAAYAGMAAGSLSFMTDDQMEKAGLKNEQYKLFGMDYRSIGHAAMPLVLAADIFTFRRLKQIEEQTGQRMTKEGVGYLDVVLGAFKGIAGDQPLSQGVKQVTQILGSDKQRDSAITGMFSSFTVVPAFARKIIAEITTDQRKVDFTNSTWQERVAYGALGLGVANYKTDRFGYDVIDERSIVQKHIFRQAPDWWNNDARDQIDQAIGSDTTGIIKGKPSTIAPNFPMNEFRSGNGTVLGYHYDQMLQKTKIKGLTLNSAVLGLINKPSWREKFNKGSIMGAPNEGLVELNKLMQRYYEATKKALLKDGIIVNTFINKDGESLTNALKKQEGKKHYSKPVDLGGLF